MIHLAFRMFDDGKVMAAVAVGLILSVLVSGFVAHRVGGPQRYVMLMLFSAVLVAVAMLQVGRAGGGVLDRNPLVHFSLARISTCSLVGDGGLLRWDDEAKLNVLLYAPLGVFATLASRRPVGALMCIALSAAVLEAVQTLADAGVCTVLDIGHNVAGAAIGVGATVAVQQAVRRFRTYRPASGG
jgi:VanZ like family